LCCCSYWLLGCWSSVLTNKNCIAFYFFIALSSWFSPLNFPHNLHLLSRLSFYISKVYFPVTKITESVQSTDLQLSTH
jgi:hypothetical protein